MRSVHCLYGFLIILPYLQCYVLFIRTRQPEERSVNAYKSLVYLFIHLSLFSYLSVRQLVLNEAHRRRAGRASIGPPVYAKSARR